MNPKDVPRHVPHAAILGAILIFFAAATGCRHPDASQTSSLDTAGQARAQAQAVAKKLDTARGLLEEVPPPAKSRYLSIHTTESWSNPFIIVGSSNLTLRIIYPDQTHSSALPSALLKPARARRQELVVRLADLPDALSALPQEEWPYGRVIAVEEDPAETRANQRQVRRNIESAMQTLNNLGVVIYEWPSSGPQR